MLRRAVTATVFIASLAALSFAADKPNFTGTWKLNVAKSDFGALPPPEQRIDVIDHTDPTVKVAVTNTGQEGKQEFNFNLATDGKETSIKMGPTEMKATGAYDGSALVINGKGTFSDQEFTVKYTWTLSADGKTLTDAAHYVSAMGEMDQKLIYEKQDGGAPAGASVTVATTAPVAPAPTPSGPKPNMSGTWKLIVAKSDFGVMPAPEERVDVIEHTDPIVKLSRKEKAAEGPREYVVNSTTDGKEVANDLGGVELKVTGSWEGANLVANIKMNVQGQDITIHQVNSLSQDGKVLTTKSHIVSAMGEMDQVEVYEKQP